MPAYQKFETIAIGSHIGNVGLIDITHCITDKDGLTSYVCQTINLEWSDGVLKATLGGADIMMKPDEKD